MSVSLCGPHRTGKTTTARAFAQKYNLPFVQTGATEVFKALGLDPKAEYPIERRIAIQAAILQAFEEQWLDACKRSTFFISDRSPLDLASYLIADVSRQTLEGQTVVAEAVNHYIARCIESANRFFSLILLVQPGIPLVEAAGKAPACPAYMEHLNLIQLGLLIDPKLSAETFIIPRPYITIEERVACIAGALASSQDNHARAIRRGQIVLH